MADLSTTYMGLKLDNPLIVGSSALTRTADGVKKCAEAGAGAVVLKSIFEEAITHEVNRQMAESADSMVHPEAMDYVQTYAKDNEVGNYLRLIGDAKKAVDIPVIASVHCVSTMSWPEFAVQAVEAGADALELNAFVLPSDPTRDSAAIEQVYVDMVEAVKGKVNVPVALKLGSYFSSLAHTAAKLGGMGVGALTLFNRFFVNDIDIEDLSLKRGGYLSSPTEYRLPLRWISLLHGRTGCDLAASTGVHSGETAIKLLLAGASAVQVVSALYRNELAHLGTMRNDISTWMDKHEFNTVDEFQGRLSQKDAENPAAYERVQFMKFAVGME